MLPGDFLVHFDAPTRAGRDRKGAVSDLRLKAEELIAPGHVIEVIFEEEQIGHDGGEMRAYGRAKMAVEIVRRNREAKQLRGIRSLFGLEKSVPENVDAYDVRAVTAQQIEIRPGVP